MEKRYLFYKIPKLFFLFSDPDRRLQQTHLDGGGREAGRGVVLEQGSLQLDVGEAGGQFDEGGEVICGRRQSQGQLQRCRRVQRQRRIPGV